MNRQAITWTNDDHILLQHMALQIHTELISHQIIEQSSFNLLLGVPHELPCGNCVWATQRKLHWRQAQYTLMGPSSLHATASNLYMNIYHFIRQNIGSNFPLDNINGFSHKYTTCMHCFTFSLYSLYNFRITKCHILPQPKLGQIKYTYWCSSIDKKKIGLLFIPEMSQQRDVY